MKPLRILLALLFSVLTTVPALAGPIEAQEIPPFVFAISKNVLEIGETTSLMFATHFGYDKKLAKVVVDVTTEGLDVYGKKCVNKCSWSFTNINTNTYSGMSNTYQVTANKEGIHRLTARFRQYGHDGKVLKEESKSLSITIVPSWTTRVYMWSPASFVVTVKSTDGKAVGGVTVVVTTPNKNKYTSETDPKFGEAGMLGLSPSGYFTIQIKTNLEIVSKKVDANAYGVNITYTVRPKKPEKTVQ